MSNYLAKINLWNDVGSGRCEETGSLPLLAALYIENRQSGPLASPQAKRSPVLEKQGRNMKE
jgi:hypothetical protein